MKPSIVAIIALVACALVIAAIAYLMQGHTIALLSPKGLIAEEELGLIGNVVSLMLIVTVSVFTLAFFFAWWYRAGNTHATYSPNWEHGALSELVWWAVPIEIVLVLAAVTWTSTHALDPHKALAASSAPLTVQVVALPWKWLFIYPEQGVATVNELELPVNRPVRFEITSDAPMNSFWIPELGGQIYAMTGMSTELNLIADHAGTFRGGSANYSGAGFARMTFQATAASPDAFSAWVRRVQSTGGALSSDAYAALAKPNEEDAPIYYASVIPGLYGDILAKFDGPAGVGGAHQH